MWRLFKQTAGVVLGIVAVYLALALVLAWAVTLLSCKAPPQQDSVKVSTHTVQVKNAGKVEIHILESDTLK